MVVLLAAGRPFVGSRACAAVHRRGSAVVVLGVWRFTPLEKRRQ